MSTSAQNSRGRTAPCPENPQNAEQWNRMLEHVRQHHEAQISQLVETVRSYGLEIARNPDGTFTVNADEDASPFPDRVNCHRMLCSLSVGTANGSKVSRPMNQPISRPSMSDMPQKFRRPQRSATDQPNSPQLQQFKRQQLKLNQQLDVVQSGTSKPQFSPDFQSGEDPFSASQSLQYGTLQQYSPGLQSGKVQFSTSEPLQFGTLQQGGPGLQSKKGPFSAPQPLQFDTLPQPSPGPQFGQGPLSASQPLQFGTLQQCSPDSQSWKGQFSTSRHQQFDKSWQFGAGLQTNMGQLDIPQPPQFSSFLEFCMAQQASSIPQALRSGEGQLLSASSQGPLAPVIPQASCLQHPFGSPLTTPRSQPLQHRPCSFSLSQNQHELSPYKPCPPQSFGSLSYASGPSHVMTKGESYEHALSPQNDQTVSHHTGVTSTMVPFAEASFVIGSSNLNAPIDPLSSKNIDSLLTQAISPHPSQVPKELDATRSPDPHVVGCIKMALARGSTAGLNVSQHHKPATPNDRKKASGRTDNIQKEPLIRPLRWHKHFGIPLSEVFNHLVEQGLLQPMKNYQPKNPNAILNTAEHCAFHRYHGHTTDRCWLLKKVIRELVNQGKVEFLDKPNMVNKPFSNNSGVNTTEFEDSSMVNVREFGPPLGDMDGLVSEASHQATLEPPSNCTSCINWGSFGSRANDNVDDFEEISSIKGQNIMRPQV